MIKAYFSTMKLIAVTAIVLFSLCIVNQAYAAEGDTIRWIGTSGGYWHDTANWNLGRVPEDGDIVQISGDFAYAYHWMYLTNSTPNLKKLVVGTNRKMGVRGWDTCIRAEEVEVSSYSEYLYNLPEISCGAVSKGSMSNRVWIVCNKLTIGSYGSLTAAGYSTSSSAGAYGGKDGNGNGTTYGSITHPLDFGTPTTHCYGGGLIQVETKDLIMNGSISAGGKGDAYGWSAGSGGSVYIRCETISGTGSVSANGGSYTSGANTGTAGGGGRVAVYYDPVKQNDVTCNVSFAARGGSYFGAAGSTRYGSIGYCGSLYFTDDRFTRREGVKLAGKVYYGDPVQRMVFPAGDNLELQNCLFELEDGDNINIAGNLSFTGSSARQNGIRVANGSPTIHVGGNLTLTGSRIRLEKGGRLEVVGNLTQATGVSGYNSAEVYLKAAATNGADQAYGAELVVGGDWTIGAYGAYYPVCNPTDGAIVKATAKNFSLAATGIVSANSAGWGSARGPGVSSEYHHGGSYGGLGGNTLGVERTGTTYGDYRHPLMPGSSTARINTSKTAPTGGGVVYIETTGNMGIDGSITANGGGSAEYVAGASGGSIYLMCGRMLAGAGELTATGGNNTSSDAKHGGGGGGGRIAVWYNRLDPNMSITATAPGGKGYNETERTLRWGEDGTVYWRKFNHHTVLLMR